MQEENDYKKANLKTYQQLVNKLIYLSYSTRLNIAFVVGQLSKYNLNLRVGHLKVAKQVISYFEGMIHFRIIYKGTLKLDRQTKALNIPSLYGLIMYTNSKYVGDPEDSKLVIK